MVGDSFLATGLDLPFSRREKKRGSQGPSYDKKMNVFYKYVVKCGVTVHEKSDYMI